MSNPDQPVLAQKYRLIGQLQAGGMGSVWIAEHIHLSSLVAVKLMGRDVAATAAGTERFLLEARAAASLRSPHVVQILDYGVHEGTPFIAMELLEGESLGARLQRDGRFQSWEKAELILRQIARAVAKAHDAGIVHRDLKPSNIFLVRNEEEEIVKLLDFGIAKSTSARLNAAPGNHTRTGEFLGSPIYSSPEQLQASKALDHRADIWSLGVLAFECMIGRPPFVSDTLAGLVLAICMSPLPVPSEHGPVPPGFDAWFARTCARDVVERFQSVREASSELRRLVAAATGGRVSTSELSESVTSSTVHSGTERIPALPESVPAVTAPPSSAPTDPTVRHPRRSLQAGEPAPPQLPAARQVPAALPWQLAAQRAETQAGLGDAPGSARQRRPTTPLLLGLALLVAVPSLPFALRALGARAALDGGARGPGMPPEQAATSTGASVQPLTALEVAPSGPATAVPELTAPLTDMNETAAPAGAAAPEEPPSAAETTAHPGAEPPPAQTAAAEGQPAATAQPAGKADSPASSAEGRAPSAPTAAVPSPEAPPGSAMAPLPQEAPASPLPATAPASITSPPAPPRENAPQPSRATSSRSKQARLTITASSTASVFLDGIPVGTTPIEDVALAPGEHEVTFVHDGERSTQRVRLRAGEHKRVAFQPAPGDGLDEGAVQRTVRRYGATVREECWEAALREKGATTEPSSARITATITVEPSGRVRSVATEGASDAFPALPYCIEDEVRTWVFPSAPGETVVTVPFVFVSE